MGASIDNWDAAFSEAWRTSDLVDAVLCYATTVLIKKVRVRGGGVVGGLGGGMGRAGK